MPADPEHVLRRLAAGDERFLGIVPGPPPATGGDEPIAADALDRQTRMLVRLAALLALGASTTSLRWAAELASINGAGVDTLTGVLLASAPAAGTARLVETAPRLALALGYDMELEGWDGS
jgi:hypothetical protein